MIRDAVQDLVRQAVEGFVQSGSLTSVDVSAIEIADTRQREHGDFMTNFAMVASKSAGKNPRELASLLADSLQTHHDVFFSVEVAGPGFLNFRLQPGFLASFVPKVLFQDTCFGTVSTENPQRINVEFVSVNPNGPITIGSGRGAAYGSTLCNVLEAAGNTVHREYYINDGVNSEQMRLFAISVQALVRGEPVPENGYKGDYVQEVADALRSLPGAPDQNADWFQQQSQALMLTAQKEALTAFSVEFDTWFSEQSLHDSGQVTRELDVLLKGEVADDHPIRRKLKLAKGGKIEDVEVESQANDEENADASGDQATVWLRSTRFGDDMDRVLRRRDGRLTYISSDVAYHWDKFNRPPNTDKLITVLGPDHHGYIGRLQAVVAALLLAEGKIANPPAGPPLDEAEAKLYSNVEERDLCQAALAEARKRLEVQIFQLVRFLKDGLPAPMRKRDGNIYALIDLIKEIGEKMRPDGTKEEKLVAGRDVARFFYLMRSHDTTFDFDLNLAETKSDENPVFYVQYAHARICSILAKAKEQGLEVDAAANQGLKEPQELALILKICDLPWEVGRSAKDFGVHRLVTYAIELSRTFHHFYDACRVMQLEQPELTQSRLALCAATRVALRSTLKLLGVSAPEKM